MVILCHLCEIQHRTDLYILLIVIAHILHIFRQVHVHVHNRKMTEKVTISKIPIQLNWSIPIHATPTNALLVVRITAHRPQVRWARY